MGAAAGRAPGGNVCLPAVVGEGRPREGSPSRAGVLLQLPLSLVFTRGFYREFKAYLPVALAVKAYQVSVQKGRATFAKIKTKWLSNFHQRRTYSCNCTVYLACFHKTFNESALNPEPGPPHLSGLHFLMCQVQPLGRLDALFCPTLSRSPQRPPGQPWGGDAVLPSEGGLPRRNPRGARDKATFQLWDTVAIVKDPQETQLSLGTRERFLEKEVPKPKTGRKR